MTVNFKDKTCTFTMREIQETNLRTLEGILWDLWEVFLGGNELEEDYPTPLNSFE